MSESTSTDAPVLECRRVGKCYRIYARPADRLLEGFDGVLPARLRRSVPRGREFHALRDVDFSLMRGETLGVIGRNGAGKSTLLQIIAGTLSPTTGGCRVHGRVAALLELGAGFNPLFTGMENVRLTASLYGLSHAELEARLDDILRFADIGDFIDQPVSTYSSGMYVRLAFAVVISIEPDVLIVDEALSVGDAAFQAKCMLRIRELQERGVTLLFVSHDIGAVRALCRRALYLDHGRVVELGAADAVLDRYVRDTHALQAAELATAAVRPVAAAAIETTCDTIAPEMAERVRAFEAGLRSGRHGSGAARVRLVELLDQNGRPVDVAEFDQAVRVRIVVQASAAAAISVNYKIRDRFLTSVAGSDFLIQGEPLLQVIAGGWYVVEYATRLPLMAGDYSLRISLTVPIALHAQADFLDVIEVTHPFKVLPSPRGHIYTQVHLPGTVTVTDVAAVTAAPKWALVVGHPGHELRVLGWLGACRPPVAVITDGSGHGTAGRLPQTTEILAATGAPAAGVYGALTDRDVYAAILSGDTALFVDCATRLAEWLRAADVECVASDGIEGYNPTHDLCAAMVAHAARHAGVRHYTFPLVGPTVPDHVPGDAVRIALDDAALDDKLALSRRYAASAGGLLVEEVEEMIERLGREAFREEVLLPADTSRDFAAFDATPPFYETHGERQVAAGHYRDVIRFHQHVKPLLQALEA